MPLNGKYLLDTNIIIALFAEERSIQEHLDQARETFIPCIVLGELYYGAKKSGKIKENMKRIEDFASENAIIDVSGETARLYAAIKLNLKKKGTSIPENDIWISAIAQQYQLILVSRDGHFNEVDNLNFEMW